MQCCWDQACTALSHGTRLHALVVALVNGVDQSWTPERHVKAYSDRPGLSRNKRVPYQRRRIPQNDGGNTQQTLCSPRFPQDLDLFRPTVPVRTSAALRARADPPTKCYRLAMRSHAGISLPAPVSLGISMPDVANDDTAVRSASHINRVVASKLMESV
jgi:hypothetical protein